MSFYIIYLCGICITNNINKKYFTIYFIFLKYIVRELIEISKAHLLFFSSKYINIGSYRLFKSIFDSNKHFQTYPIKIL